MPKYKVTGHVATIGVGTVLKLSNSQSAVRSNSLKAQSKDTFTVLEPVQFKQGEEIFIVSGNVSKSLLNNLTDLSPDKKGKEDNQNQKPAKNNKAPAKNQNNKSAEKVNNKGAENVDDNSDEIIDSPDDSEDEQLPPNDDINNLPNV